MTDQVRKILTGQQNNISDTVKEVRESINIAHYQRVVVTDVLINPGQLNAAELSELQSRVNTMDITRLPRNSIIGRRVIHSSAAIFSSYQLFMPFFPPHLTLPVKVGEHVWVMYESSDRRSDIGFWFCRISDLRDVDDVNYTHADRKFHPTDKKSDDDDGTAKFPNGVPGDIGTHSLSYEDDPYTDLLTASNEREHQFEPVPRFTKRPADLAIQGSNNTLICLGTERIGPALKITDKGADGVTIEKPDGEIDVDQGAIDMVVGRGQKDPTKPKTIKNFLGTETDKSLMNESGTEQEGDPDFINDSARIYLSMAGRPDIDFSLGLSAAGLVVTQDDEKKRRPTAAVKADSVRIIARKDIRMIVKADKDTPDSECAGVIIKATGDIVFIPSAKGLIYMGGEDADKAVLCTRVVTSKAGGNVTASPIVDTMAGSQGGADGLNGVFASKVLMK